MFANNGGWLPKDKIELEGSNDEIFKSLFELYIKATLANQIYNHKNIKPTKREEINVYLQNKKLFVQRARTKYNKALNTLKTDGRFKDELKEFINQIKQGRDLMRKKEYREPYKAIFNNMVDLPNIPSVKDLFNNGKEDAAMKA